MLNVKNLNQVRLINNLLFVKVMMTLSEDRLILRFDFNL
jgi:hypothetical protein